MTDGAPLTAAAGVPLTAAALAARLGARLEGDGARAVTGVCPLTEPRAGCLAFIDGTAGGVKAAGQPAQLADLGAVIVPPGLLLPGAAPPRLVADNPRLAFARALELFDPEPAAVPGVHPSAVVHLSAQLGAGVSIGPQAVVGARAELGAGVVLGAGAVVGDDVVLGEGTKLFPHVVVYHGCRLGARVRVHAGTVIGSDGFGYVWDGTRHYKVPQTGNVIIEDEVELGANVTIDRGTVGPTLVRRGVKIDNLVHLAHNVEVGEDSMLVAQVGVSGSAAIGPGCVLGGQVGVAGHLVIGPRATIAAKSGVSKNVPGNGTYSGFPLRPHEEEKKIKAALGRLPGLLRRVARLEQRAPGDGKA